MNTTVEDRIILRPYKNYFLAEKADICTVGVTNRCRCILVHIFSLVQAILLEPVGFERGLFLDAVGEIAASKDKNFSFGGHLKECVSIALIPVNR